MVLRVLLAMIPVLLAFGLGYRLWRWIITPDEKTLQKRETRREQLKRTVRRPAEDVPLHDDLPQPGDLSDPALNDEHFA